MSASEIIQLACNGDKDAERFCMEWCRFCHLIDDIVDEGERRAERVANTLFSFIMEVCGNPWFQPRKACLLGVMRQAVNYWLQSNHRQGAERDIHKGYWHSVIYEVAAHCGGIDHMLHVTAETLEFDYEKGVS